MIESLITAEINPTLSPDLLRAWGKECGLPFGDVRVQFPDNHERGQEWANKFRLFEAGWGAGITHAGRVATNG